jgi:precorrin-6B methylase 2
MSDYTLAVSDAEVMRYRLMAETARDAEAAQLRLAGVVAGANVADVGCGPAAMSVELARLVGPTGSVIAVERDEVALSTARDLIRQAGVSNIDLRPGEASASGIEPGSLDVVMMRHVLAHNGGHEQQIVDHLASLVRPGGAVYLVDVDLAAVRILDADPDLDDVSEKYVQFHVGRGNDPVAGLRLGQRLRAANLDVVHFTGMYNILTVPPGMRPPPWAAREAMLAAGTVTDDDIARWGAAFERLDAATVRPTIFAPVFVAIGVAPS